MTLPLIKAHFFPGKNAFEKMSDAQKCKLLFRALPFIQSIARVEASGTDDPDKMSSNEIMEYLCTRRQYDATEISWIVKIFIEEMEDGNG